MFASIPANLAYAPLSTLVPLYILALGGGALDVALAVSLFNGLAMASSFLWGKATDTTGKRRQLIIISYIGMTALLFAMYAVSSLLYIVLLYGGIAVFWTACTTPYNLLVMETDEPNNWSRNFSRYQTIANVGMVVGLIVAAIVTEFSSLRLLVLIFAFAALAATAIAAVLVIDPEVHVKDEIPIIRHLNNIVFAIFSYPFRFIKLPGLKSIMHTIRMIRDSPQTLVKRAKTQFALLGISWLVFNIGISMFNTEYSASLNIHGLSESSVFEVILVAMTLQTIFFYYAQRIINKKKLHETSMRMIAVRGISYVFVGISFLAMGAAFFAANLVLYALIAGISYPLYYTASYTILFSTIGDNNRGNALGIYNGVGWFGYFLGAIITGGALAIGFPVLYAATGLVVLSSILPFRLVARPQEQPRQGPASDAAKAGMATTAAKRLQPSESGSQAL